VTALEQLVVFLAGVAAGTINTIVGSGTLVTFPVLLAVGYSPVVANVSNTVGLVPGFLSGVIGYRRELAGQRGRLLRLGVVSVLGGLSGGLLLLTLPRAFEAIVPMLILVGVLLVTLQPRLAKWLAVRRGCHRTVSDHGGVLLLASVYAAGVYGGYFGAAMGVILLALFGILLDDDLQRLNAAKNVLSMLINLVAALIFVFAAPVAWLPVTLIAVGAIVGGQIGATVGRRLAPNVLRGVIVVVGLVAVGKLLTT
jgi:uncharacterized protein